MRMMALTLFASICFAADSRAAGLSQIEITSSDGSPLQGAIWSPCAAPAETVRLRRIDVPGVRDCPVEGERLPLIVMSHGARGWFGGHHDTASALADAGFVVAAVTHQDEGRAWRTERPATISRLVDHMLGAWPDHDRLAPDRIGLFGFSRGGYTGLVLIGGEPDFARIVQHCRDVPDDPLCTQLSGSASRPASGRPATPLVFHHDPRIKAAVVAAPLGIVFSPKGLKNVSVPVQLWRAEHDERASYHNVDAVLGALPNKPDYQFVVDAGHFVFLAPCTERQARAVPAFCHDERGFDRVAFHERFNADVLAFFQRVLGNGEP